MNSSTIIAALAQIADRLFEEGTDGRHRVTFHDIEVATKLAARQIEELLLQARLDEVGHCASWLPSLIATL
ncbi:MAG: hypothetical protein NUW23_08375 [Firmicutes bacterium]|nr:hypothetical protein [Bacillota bacterium]